MSIDCWVQTLSYTAMILAGLTTALIGWQIYMYIKFDKAMEKKVDDKIKVALDVAMGAVSESMIENKLELQYNMLMEYTRSQNMDMIIRIIPSMVDGILSTKSKYRAETMIMYLSEFDEEAKGLISKLNQDIVNDFRQSVRKLAQIDERAFEILEFIRDVGQRDSL